MDNLKPNNFILPIEFLPYKQKIFKNLYQDLELIKTHNNTKPIYEELFKPKTTVGKNFLVRWADHYTTNTKFIKDSQKFYTNIHDISQNTNLVEEAFTSWDTLKKETNFSEKYILFYSHHRAS